MYQCDGCPKRFQNPNPLKAHLRTHAWDSPRTPSSPESNSFGFGDKPLNLTPFRPYDPAFSFHNARQIKSTGSSPDFTKPASYSTSPIQDFAKPAPYSTSPINSRVDSTPIQSYNPFLYHPVTLAVLPHIYPAPFPINLPYGGLYPMLPYPPPLLSNNGPRVVPNYKVQSQNLVSMSMAGASGWKIEPGNIFLENPGMQGSDEIEHAPETDVPERFGLQKRISVHLLRQTLFAEVRTEDPRPHSHGVQTSQVQGLPPPVRRSVQSQQTHPLARRRGHPVQMPSLRQGASAQTRLRTSHPFEAFQRIRKLPGR